MSKLRRFSHAEIKKMSERDEYANGNYAFVLSSYERKEEEGKQIQLKLTFNALTDPEDVGSKFTRASQSIYAFISETESSGPDDFVNFKVQQSARLACALLPNQGEIAKWNKPAKQWVLSDGTEMDSEEGNAHNSEVMSKAFDALLDAYEEESNETLDSLVGQVVVYGTIKRTPSKTEPGKFYVNLDNIRKSLMDGEELVDPDNFLHAKAEPEVVHKSASSVKGKAGSKQAKHK